MKKIVLIIVSLMILGPNAYSNQNKGLEVALKMDKSNTGFIGEMSKMTMTLINAHGDKTIRKMESKTLEVDGDGDKSLILFKWPTDVKGTKMLTWSHKNSDDDQWLYLPAMRRVKRISSRNKSGAFMGSEFSYEDLGSQEVEKFTYNYLKDEKIKSRDTWVIERFPIDKKSGYLKQVLWVDKEYNNPIKIKYFDRKGELLKLAEFGEYKKLKGIWRVNQIHMLNKQTEKESVLVWKDRKLKRKLKKVEFSKRGLK